MKPKEGKASIEASNDCLSESNSQNVDEQTFVNIDDPVEKNEVDLYICTSDAKDTKCDLIFPNSLYNMNVPYKKNWCLQIGGDHLKLPQPHAGL